MLGASNSCSAGAIENHAHFGDIFPDNFQGVQQSCARDDCRSMLIVVEDGNLHRLAQCLFNFEAVWSLDVFKIDAAESRLEQLAELDDLFGIMAIHFDVEDIDIRESLPVPVYPSYDFIDVLAGERELAPLIAREGTAAA